LDEGRRTTNAVVAATFWGESFCVTTASRSPRLDHVVSITSCRSRQVDHVVSITSCRSPHFDHVASIIGVSIIAH